MKVLFDHTASGSGFQKIEFQKARLLSSNLKLISSTFNLTDEDFSQICGVTRKTIHNWKNNLSAIQSKNSSKIFNLIIAAKNWKVNGFKVSRNELRTEIISGKSIFDILKGTPLNQNLLNMAGQRLALSTQPKKLENPFS